MKTSSSFLSRKHLLYFSFHYYPNKQDLLGAVTCFGETMQC